MLYFTLFAAMLALGSSMPQFFPQQQGFAAFGFPAAPQAHLFPAGVVPFQQQAQAFPQQHQAQPQSQSLLNNIHHQQDLEGQRKIAEAERAQQAQALQHERTNQAIQQQQQQQLSALASQRGIPAQPQVHSVPAQQPFTFPFHPQQPFFQLG